MSDVHHNVIDMFSKSFPALIQDFYESTKQSDNDDEAKKRERFVIEGTRSMAQYIIGLVIWLFVFYAIWNMYEQKTIRVYEALASVFVLFFVPYGTILAFAMLLFFSYANEMTKK